MLRAPFNLARRARGIATAPTKQVLEPTLKGLGQLSTQGLVDALWVLGYPANMIEAARPLRPPGQQPKLVGRAVTLGFVPFRPDIMASKPKGIESPEYVAFELCGPGEVLVTDSVGPWESIGGDIKFLRLKQRQVAGLVTDGSVRDTNVLTEYGFPVYSFSTTAKQGPAAMVPWSVNQVLKVGSVAVCPGDVLVGDDDGVVVVPSSKAEEVLRIGHEREAIEDIIKAELQANPGPPGKYYPFTTPVPEGTPLAELLARKR